MHGAVHKASTCAEGLFAMNLHCGHAKNCHSSILEATHFWHRSVSIHAMSGGGPFTKYQELIVLAQFINTYSTLNLGDAAIYEALEELVELHGGSRHTVGHKSLPDLFISVGGDIFNNARPWLTTRTFAGNVLSLAKHPASKTMLFGQSIPRSCRGPSLLALAHTLKKLAAVSVRDEVSRKQLSDLGVNARLGVDTVFALKPEPYWDALGRQVLEAKGLDSKRVALISLRIFVPLYQRDTCSLLQRLAALCQLLTGRGHQPALLIQSDAPGDDSDRQPAAWLQARLPDLPIIDPFASGLSAPWEVAAAVTGAANIVVAVRYHAAIFRMMQGRTPFTLYYSNKGRDLVERLGQPGCDVSDFDPVSMIDAIERSADGSVDAAALRSAARQDFAECWKLTTGSRSATAEGALYAR